MARPRTIEERDLIAALARVFATYGYDGASLAHLAQATGLQRASLYHRFPGGKAQMAEEVLKAVGDWVEAEVVAPLCGAGPPRERLTRALGAFNRLYEGGTRACLLNMLSAPGAGDEPLRPAIGAAFDTLTAAFAHLARDAGQPDAAAQAFGERAVMLVQGSLVMCRGTGRTAPFTNALTRIEDDLFPRMEALS